MRSGAGTGINPNTIQKAYAELERQGVIYSLKGRGSFVGSSLNELRSVQQAALLEEVAQLSGALCQLAVEQETVCAVVREAYQTPREARTMIDVKGLSKKFDQIQALQQVSTQIQKGSIFGLIGSNGAGKSTFLRLLAGIYRPDSGEIFWRSACIWKRSVKTENFLYLRWPILFS